MFSLEEVLHYYNSNGVLPHFEGNTKNGCFLPRPKYRYLEDRLYITKPGQLLSTQFKDAELCPFREEDKNYWKKIEKTMLVICLLFLHVKQSLTKTSS